MPKPWRCAWLVEIFWIFALNHKLRRLGNGALMDRMHIQYCSHARAILTIPHAGPAPRHRPASRHPRNPRHDRAGVGDQGLRAMALRADQLLASSDSPGMIGRLLREELDECDCSRSSRRRGGSRSERSDQPGHNPVCRRPFDLTLLRARAAIAEKYPPVFSGLIAPKPHVCWCLEPESNRHDLAVNGF